LANKKKKLKQRERVLLGKIEQVLKLRKKTLKEVNQILKTLPNVNKDRRKLCIQAVASSFDFIEKHHIMKMVEDVRKKLGKKGKLGKASKPEKKVCNIHNKPSKDDSVEDVNVNTDVLGIESRIINTKCGRTNWRGRQWNSNYNEKKEIKDEEEILASSEEL